LWSRNPTTAAAIALQLLAHRFDPRGEVDRRPGHGEIEPGVAADIAVNHVADVQRDSIVDARGVFLFPTPALLAEAAE
jgi:hypothetical protein